MYTTFEISKQLKINRSNLQQYIDRGFIVPSIVADGRGTKNLFSKEDVIHLYFFLTLHKVGLTQKEASREATKIPMNVELLFIFKVAGVIKYANKLSDVIGNAAILIKPKQLVRNLENF